MLVLLDTTPLGLAVHPNANQSKPILTWLAELRKAKVQVKIPAISDYELRRELLRIDSKRSLQVLDKFIELYGYLPLNRRTMNLAASFWSDLRKIAKAGSHDKELDGDVILAAQAAIEKAKSENKGNDVVIATENLKHFANLSVTAMRWGDIKA